MKGLAFALDPDGYWVELVKREKSTAPVSDPITATPEDEELPSEVNARTLSILVSAEDAKNKVVKTGFLNKEGGRIKSWKKRYFVLTPSAIAYYSDQRRMDTDLKGGVLMENIVKAQPADPSTCKKQHAFTILTGERNFQVQAASHEEREVWIEAINQCIANLNPEGLSSSSLAREKRVLNEKLNRYENVLKGQVKPAAKPELIYFDGLGRGELTRIIFTVGGVDFTDTRLTFQEFGKQKADPNSDINKRFSRVPLLKVGDVIIAEAQATAEYAAEVSLHATALTPEQRALDRMLKGIHGELQVVCYGLLFGSDESKAAKKETFQTDCTKFMKGIENTLPESGFLHGGDKPSLGDLALFDLYSSKFPGLKELGLDFTDYPKFEALAKKVAEFEPVKKYCETRGF